MKRLLLFAAVAVSLHAQPVGPVQPDCSIQLFNVTVTGAGTAFDNRGLYCVDWTVTVQFRGFSGASVELDSAPDNNGVAGAFGVFAGTVVSGSNPMTVFTQNSSSVTVTGFFPWLRLNITSLTGSGSINVIAAGFRPIAFNLIKGVDITQIGPINLFGDIKSAFINYSSSGSGNTQLISASGTTTIYIFHIDAGVFSPSLNFKLTEGTGAACVTGTADLTALTVGAVSIVQDYGPFTPLIIKTAGDGVCVNLSANTTAGVNVIYAQK